MEIKKIKLTIGELLEKVKQEKSIIEKQKLLKLNDSKMLRMLLKLNYDTTCNISVDFNKFLILSDFPRGSGKRFLISEDTRFHMFFDKYFPLSINWNEEQRQRQFEDLVQNLDLLESKFLVDICKKSLKLGLSVKQINEVFKDLIVQEVI